VRGRALARSVIVKLKIYGIQIYTYIIIM
jgi:hypothetical protein